MKTILASSSPRRQELLKLIVDEFSIIPSNIPEEIPNGVCLIKSAQYLARLKANEVSKANMNCLVIGCDTCVITRGQLLGKPQNDEEAFKMLSLLSGKVHKVVTGCCLVLNGSEHSFSEITKVKFHRLSAEDIKNYIMTNEPFDKAGGYGIQGKGSLLVKRICGDYFNVMGLPISRLNKEIKIFLSKVNA